MLTSAAPAAAQHALAAGSGYDPAIPTPASVLGYEVGERFTPHHLLHRYYETVAALSPRVVLDTVARTFEGREVLMAIVTSEANHARLEQIRQASRRIADPRGASAAELDAAAAALPAIVWLGFTVHGSEASGAEAAIALLYQLAAGGDATTRTILDSAVVLIDPLQNPDGHERHAQDVMRRRGVFGPRPEPYAMVHNGSWPGPRTSHYHFDLNRDWIVHSHPETQGRIAALLDWNPHVAVDLHEMGSNSTYYFAPPMQPVNENVPDFVRAWWNDFAAANAAAFDVEGWSFFRRENYDEFYPGYGSAWPIYTGAVGMTYEQASSGGGAIRRTDGTVLTLREAAAHHYATSIATALTAARGRARLIADYRAFRQRAATEPGSPRAVLFARDADGRADSLAALLLRNGVEVQRTTADADVRDARRFGAAANSALRAPAGTYVVDMAQPMGTLARALLEPEAQLDSVFLDEELENRRTGQGNRFYDVTAWALPYLFRVDAWTSSAPPAALERVTALPQPPAATPPQARYGYAFAPGSEASIRMLAGLLADSVRVWFAQRSFRAAAQDFPTGAFVVRVAANDGDVHDVVARHAQASGARVTALSSAMVEEGTDLGSGSVFFVQPVRVGLLGGAPISGNSHGYAWYAFDQRIRYPVIPVEVEDLSANTLADLDVIVVPSTSAGGLNGELGEGGRERIGDWVRAGGVLVALDGAADWVASEQLDLSRFRARADTVRADSTGGAPLDAGVPGAFVRTLPDTLNPILAGIRDAEIPVLAFSDRIYTAPDDLEAGEIVLRHAPVERLRLSGYIWPEVPERMADTPYLWTESVGQGRIIAFAGDPNFRDMLRGMLPIFANAVLLGASF
jgi:Zinc carboxypeptidase